MITTPNMSLTAWDQGTDIYSHTQLAQNFEAIDQHDHSPGKGVLIPTAGITNGAITTVKLADGAVTLAKLAPNSVDSSKIVDGSITGADIAPGTISVGNLGTDVLSLVPVAAVVPFAAASPPTGWLLCDGSAVSRTTYTSLFNLIGSTYGVGDGSTTFNLPDLRTRIAVGKGTAGATSLNQNDGLLASNRGLTHLHTVNSHSHTVNAHSHAVASHAHGITNDGDHNHHWLDDSSLSQQLETRRVTTSSTPDVVVYTGNNGSVGLETLFIPNQTSLGTSGEVVPMQNSGPHNHGATTGSASPSTDAQSPGTDSQSPGTSGAIALPFIVLNYIIKV